MVNKLLLFWIGIFLTWGIVHKTLIGNPLMGYSILSLISIFFRSRKRFTEYRPWILVSILKKRSKNKRNFAKLFYRKKILTCLIFYFCPRTESLSAQDNILCTAVINRILGLCCKTSYGALAINIFFACWALNKYV